MIFGFCVFSNGRIYRTATYNGCPEKKYTSPKLEVFVLRTDQSAKLVSFIKQVLNSDFDT